MSDLMPGEIVDITIKGVRNVGHPSQRLVRIADEHGDTYDMPPQAKVERVAPAEWPPRHKDVWRDGESELWIARVLPVNGGGKHTEMHGVHEFCMADTLLAKRSPLALVHREEAAPC